MSQRKGHTVVPEIAIVGFGNWGVSLAHALTVAAISPMEIIATAKRAPGNTSPRPAKGHGLPVVSFKAARLNARILWLCVPDAAVEQMTHRIVERIKLQSRAHGGKPLAGRIVVHSSGALGSEVLMEAARAGAVVASVHPLMTFPTRVPVSLVNTPFGIEAAPRDRGVLNGIVRQLGGNPFHLEGSTKALYHAATVLASPLLASLLAATGEAAALAGISPAKATQLLEPIARATLQNVFSRGASRSFSGPIARGDAATIQLHLQALAPHPMLAEIYRSLARYGVDALPARNRKKLRRILQ